MAKIAISPLVNAPDITGALNQAIQKIVNEFNDKVLYRTNPDGEENVMSNDLDMGTNDIVNVGNLDGSKITIEGTPLYEVLETAVYQTIINPENPFVVHDGIEQFVTTTVDADDLHSSGWYYTTGLGSEHPAGDVAGWLLVFARGSDGVALEYTMQVFIPHDSNYKFYVRAKWEVAGSWSSWFDMSSGPALVAHEALTSTAHDIGTQITDATAPLDARLDALEIDVPSLDARLDIVEPELASHDTRLDALEDDHYLISIITTTIALSTTPVTVMGDTDLAVDGIVRNPDGSILYPHAGRYVVSWQVGVSVTAATTVYMWLEKWNDGLAQWDLVPNSGIARGYDTSHEVEFSLTYLRVVEAGDMYRVRASKLATGTASIQGATLPNGVVMPSFRVDIRS